jgi:glucoamylase
VFALCTSSRYQGRPPLLTHELWLEQAPIDELACGMRLRLGLHSAGVFRWSLDGWRTVQELETSDSGLGLHVAEIDTSALVAGQGLEFTFRRAWGE